jgi:16S rRNA (guanine(966)-N(2))-methyltransferase RsmD
MAAKHAYQMRVLSGTLKGRLLRYPPKGALRPTMQRTKASLFESLKDSLAGAVFVDLYAGAGGMGIEAISRGASYAHFVENGRIVLPLLHRNLESCGIGPDRCRVHSVDTIDFLMRSDFHAIKPDIVFADPPYGTTDFGLLLEFLGRIEYAGLKWIVLEHERELAGEHFDKLDRLKVKKFGQTVVSFFIPYRGERA